jgi:sulfur carrier protein
VPVIRLNGRESDVAVGETVAAVLARLELPRDARGVAVAVDGEVVPRAEWSSFAIAEHARVEVLTAMQGG